MAPGRTPQLEGLGTDLRTLRNSCRDDPEALDAPDRVKVARPGGAYNPHGRKGKPGQRTLNGINNDNAMIDSPKPDQGNSETYALRRLRAARPDLHVRVLQGEIKAHRAMVEAKARSIETIHIRPDCCLPLPPTSPIALTAPAPGRQAVRRVGITQ